MSKLLSRAVAPVLAAALLVGAAPALAVTTGSVPAAHVSECTDAGLGRASTMTLVSAPSARQTTGDHTSRAKAWVYAVPGSTKRCVILRVDGAAVRAKRDQRVDHSVGYSSAVSGAGVLDTGELLPLTASSYGFGGTSERTHVTTTVVDLVVSQTIPATIGDIYPTLASLGGRTVTATMSAVDFRVSTTVWTTTELARPLTRAQRRRKLAAEVTVAQDRYDARIAEATAVRDRLLDEAAAATGITADWLTLWAGLDFEDASETAAESLRAAKRLARHHAADAGRGSDARETYAHELSLEVALG